MQDSKYDQPPQLPTLILLVLAIALCIWTFWLGTVCVRTWYYKGALGPDFQKFVIAPKHRRHRASRPSLRIEEQRHDGGNMRATRFLAIDQPEVVDTFTNTTYPLHMPNLPTQTTGLEIMDHIQYTNEPDAKSKAEESRISRLPAFEQDDCGDGSQFPDIPYATKPTPKARGVARESALRHTRDYLALGLRKGDFRDWIQVGARYLELCEVRAALLRVRIGECVFVMREGEGVCEELLGMVVDALVEGHPEYFSVTCLSGQESVRCELTNQEFGLARPDAWTPMELCARLCVEDFTVFVRDAFTRAWYLQASATCFPSGHRISKFIGKSLETIINDMLDPMALWEDLPQVLDLAELNPSSLFTRTSKFIQTQPMGQSLASTLHISRPVDLFAGNTCDLHPDILTVRYETQMFRVLPSSGAVVMTTRTELKRLSELDETEKRDLVKEINMWGKEEGLVKGRDLWLRAVTGWCQGKPWMKDDKSIVDAGALTRIGD